MQRIGDASVEMRAVEMPALLRADSSGQGCHVVIGIRVAERFLRGMEEILAVDEYESALD